MADDERESRASASGGKPKGGASAQFEEAIGRRVESAIGEANQRFGPVIEEKIEAAIGSAIDEKVGAATASKLDTFATNLEPARVLLHPLIETVKFGPLKGFTNNGVPDELRKLLDNPPTLSGKASEDADGRLVPVVLAIVRDKDGATRAGIELRLLNDKSALIDHTRTDAGGLALLRFPRRTGESEDISGILAVTGGGDPIPVTVGGGVQHTLAEILLDELPPLPTVTDPVTGKEVPITPRGDDVLSRLPADFTTELCDSIQRLSGSVPDPILGGIAAPGDFRGKRTPLIKRLTIPRIGELPVGGKAPRRYLVRVRQEWTFLGYTLGELSGVEALDPGAIIEETTRTVQRTVDRASRSADDFISQATSLVRSQLTQLSSIDTLLDVATRTETSATASGYGNLGINAGIGGGVLGLVLGPIGALFGGASASAGVGAEVGTRAGTSLFTSTTTRSSADTSLVVNSAVQTAKSLVNQAVRIATSTLRDLQSTLLREINQVSPLLSRVTNLLRWILYENYAVCTSVEDIVEIRSIRITAPLIQQFFPLFSDEDIVEYRRHFEPVLLEPQLRPQFAVLRQAIAERIAGGTPITVMHVAVDFSAAVFGADLRIILGDRSLNLQLNPGANTARGSLRISPLMPNQLQQVELSLTARMPDFANFGGLFGNIFENLLNSGEVRVSRLRLWFEASPASAPDVTEDLGNTLRVTNQARIANLTKQVNPPVRLTDTSRNPLFRHINRNRTYYFGVLAQAALSIPSLRDDAPELANFNGDHALWRLPIVGFEGDRVLVISDVERDANGNIIDEDAKRLLEDAGAATIIQLAAPGAYAEALQGLLELTGDVAGKIHPALLPPLPPVMPPIALVDLTGKTLQVVDEVPPPPVTPPVPPIPPPPGP
ncbi:MAG TPA: hypothetical protein VGE45_01530 [Chloroflexia bacterium]|jgi:hypothetical protein